MPTGYTQLLHDNPDATTAEFMMRCVRAMGVCVAMRDMPISEPIPDQFPRDTYHADYLVGLRKKLEELNAMSKEDIAAMVEKDYVEREGRRLDGLAESQKKKATFERVTAEITAWEPPGEEFVQFKKFMLGQLALDDQKYMLDYYNEPSERLDGEGWMKQQIEFLNKNIEYHTRGQAEEEGRHKSRNEWLAKLRESLPK